MRPSLPAVGLGVLLSLAASPGFSAAAPHWPGPQGTTLARLDKLPDWSGTWVMTDRARSDFLQSAAAAAGTADSQHLDRRARLPVQRGGLRDGRPRGSGA